MTLNEDLNRVKYLMSGYKMETLTKTGKLNNLPGLKIEIKENSTKLAETYLLDISVAKIEEKNVSDLFMTENIDDKEVVFLYGLEVQESFRKNGYGTKILNECLNSSSELGYKKISLTVDKDNHTAKKLYTQNGFRFIKEINEVLYYEKTL